MVVMIRRALAAVVVLGLVVVGASRCDDDDDGTQGDRTLTVEKALVPVDEAQGVYRNDLMFLNDREISRIVDSDDQVLATRVSQEELLELLPDLREQEERDEILAAVYESVAVFRVSGRTDSLSVAVALRAQDVAASPVHAVGMAVHWKYSPGTKPRMIDDVDVAASASEPGQDAPTVAVIDTGLIDVGALRSRTPAASTLVGVEPLSPQDAEPSINADLQGHGTFIASLIRQFDPSVRVVVGRLSASPAKFTGHDGGKISGPLVSDELQLLAATIRMTNHLVDDGVDTVALNLSLGTPASTAEYSEGDDVDGLALGVRAAIDYWNEADWPGDEAPPVIAAAGNHDEGTPQDPPAPFLPGAYSDVYSVVALTAKGDPAPFTFLGWPGDTTAVAAPGAELLAARGVAGTNAAADQLWAWGGTSFATALVSAQTASSGSVADVDVSTVTTRTSSTGDVLVIN